MTIPHIQTSVLKQQVGPQLMRAINTIENAFQLTMVNESIEKIPDFNNKTITEIFEEFVEPVMNGSKRHFDKFKYYSNFDKSITNDIKVTTDATIFTTKDGMQFFGPTSGAIGGCQGSKCVT